MLHTTIQELGDPDPVIADPVEHDSGKKQTTKPYRLTHHRLSALCALRMSRWIVLSSSLSFGI